MAAVRMRLKRIITSEIHDQQYVELREVDGPRRFNIVIGIFEASSIDRRVRRVPTQRPLTHDLVVSVIEEMGGELQDIIINELHEHTYYAKLRVRLTGGDGMIEIDCRPSDAIAAAVTAEVPIYVEDEVLREAAGE